MQTSTLRRLGVVLSLLLTSACTSSPAEAGPTTKSGSAGKEAGEPAASDTPAKSASATATPTGYYCDMSSFTKVESKRWMELGERLKITKTVELANGYAMSLSGKFREAGEWLDGMRRCCPMVDIAASFPNRQGTAEFRFTAPADGPPGGKEFIREVLVDPATLVKAP